MKKLSLILLAVTLMASCSRRPENEVAINTRNFGEEIELQQNLSFTFTHELVPSEMVGNWDSMVYCEIEPPVAGRFRWVNASELSFSPNEGFAPGTDYRLRLTDKILDHALVKDLYLGKDLQEPIAFHTPYLQPDAISAYWTRDSRNKEVRIGARLGFNYPVEIAQLNPFLEVFLDDKPARFEVQGSGAGEEALLMIDPAGLGEEDVLLRISVKEGLPIAGTDQKSRGTQEQSQVLPSRMKLDILAVEALYENSQGQIRIETSQALVNTDFSSCYTIQPAVSATVSALSNGFIITGNFDISQVYTLTLNQSLEGELGGKLTENYIKNLTFGELKPSISFTHEDAIFLSSAGAKNIGINIVNVSKIHVTIYKIYENNILSYLRNNSYHYWDYDYDDYGGSSRRYSEDDDEVFSSIVLEKDIETASLPKANGVRVLNLSIPNENREYKGIYFVKVHSMSERYVHAQKLVSISDIGLMAKVMKDKVMVVAHSILNAKTLSGVDVSLISRNNQVMMKGKTGSDGVLIFDNLEEKAPGFTPAMVTAQSNEDFNFAPFSLTAVESSRYDVGGKRTGSSGLDAFIYSARNLYRPGETINLNTIIRTNEWESPGDIPVKMKLIMPNGKEFKTIKGKTNKQGAVEAEFTLPEFAQTGYYSFQVYNGNDLLLNDYSIQIEEFMPDRLRIKPKLAKEQYEIGDSIKYRAFVQNLYGPPAMNRNYEVTFRFNRRNYSSKKYPSYRFHDNSTTNPSPIVREGKTDNEGMVNEDFVVPESMADAGVIHLDLYTTVFDESGRPVHTLKSTRINTQKVYFGIGLDDYYVSTRTPLKLSFVAVDLNDRFKSGATAEVEIIRYEWQTVIEGSNSSYRYRSIKIEKSVLKRKIRFSSTPYELSFNPLVSGQYEVRVRKPGSDKYVSQHFYAYGWGNTESGSFQVNSEGQIEMETDKEKYEVGDKVKVLLKTPFQGKLLVTIERDDVFEYQVMETDKKSAEFSFTIRDQYAPNVYVSATLFRPMDGSGLPLTVAHGYLPVMAEKKNSRLPLEIVAVEKSRSKTTQQITIKSKPNSDIEVTFAAVDEGILQLRNFEDPDAHAFFYQKRALEVSSYDIYQYLLPEMGTKKSTGGGGSKFEEGGEKRANPLANKRVKLVSKWSGILRTNSKGEATYKLEIPQFNGELRLMAVAWKDGAFGASSKRMTVADPLVVNSGLPRFLSPQDEVQLPVNVANTTGKAANVKIRVLGEGKVAVDGQNESSLKIAANEEGVSLFVLKAKPEIGDGKIKVLVTGLGETFTEEIDISVRPSAPLTINHFSGMMQQGQHSISFPQFNQMIPQSRATQLLVSRSPMVQFTRELKKLIGYPHGCLEQTTSKAFPQLYLASFIKENSSYLSDEDELNPEFNVRAAIIKISALQQYNGSMSYWPGTYLYNNWSTVFATHFLVEARKAGYEVNQDVLDKALSHLAYRNRSRYTEEEWYLGNGTWTTRRIVDRSQVYGLYVLALAGKPDKSQMNYYKANPEQLSTDSRYLLGAAYALIGDMKSFQLLAPQTFREEISRNQLGGNFSSTMRNLAISLHTLVESDPGNKQIPTLARMLSEQFKSRSYHSTQELVFSMLAFGKLHKKLENATSTAILKSGDRVIGRFDGKKDLKIRNLDLESGVLNVEVSGNGPLYYYASLSGIPANGEVVERDNYLRVRRTFYDRNGNQITGNVFKQNQMVVVKISINSLMSEMENVAITDMLPAGFEVENPRLNDLPGMDWIRDKSSPQYYDFRDDRVNLYTNAGSYVQNYYYIVRVVSKGRFRLGPVAADAMYNGEYHSYYGAGWIRVE